MGPMANEESRAKLKLRKNDTVKVIAGRDKGKSGRIIRIDREKLRAVVEGLNMVKKAVKQKKQNQKGGITSIEAPHFAGQADDRVQEVRAHADRIFPFHGETKKRVCRKCGGDL